MRRQCRVHRRDRKQNTYQSTVTVSYTGEMLYFGTQRLRCEPHRFRVNPSLGIRTAMPQNLSEQWLSQHLVRGVRSHTQDTRVCVRLPGETGCAW